MSEEYTGGSVSYYRVHVSRPTSDDVQPYRAECNDIIEALGMNYAEGNAFKALWRRAAARNLGMAKKGYEDGLYDAEKVVFFGQRLVAQESALKAEALSEQRNVFNEIMEGTEEIAECREKDQAKAGKPEWKNAPEFASWLCFDEAWIWFEKKPSISQSGTLMPDCGLWHNTHIRDSFGYSIHYMEPRP